AVGPDPWALECLRYPGKNSCARNAGRNFLAVTIALCERSNGEPKHETPSLSPAFNGNESTTLADKLRPEAGATRNDLIPRATLEATYTGYPPDIPPRFAPRLANHAGTPPR